MRFKDWSADKLRGYIADLEQNQEADLKILISALENLYTASRGYQYSEVNTEKVLSEAERHAAETLARFRKPNP